MKKLRLILTEECHRECEGCCNKDWDLASLPRETDFAQYDMILLTGGEPMLDRDRTLSIIKRIHSQSPARLILYTAKIDDALAVIDVLHHLHGMTITLHAQEDAVYFQQLVGTIEGFSPLEKRVRTKSLRLNIFKGVEVQWPTPSMWQVKRDCEWIKDCPLPEGEVLKRY